MGRCLSLKSIPEFKEENEKKKILHQEQEPCLEMSDFGPTLQKQIGMKTEFAQEWLLQQDRKSLRDNTLSLSLTIHLNVLWSESRLLRAKITISSSSK